MLSDSAHDVRIDDGVAQTTLPHDWIIPVIESFLTVQNGVWDATVQVP